MRRRPLLLALVAAAGISAALVLGLPELVASAVRDAAERRGFVAEVGSVVLRPTRVWLEDVVVRHSEVEGFRAHLDVIEVRIGWGGVRALTVHGGAVRLKGDRQDLLQQFRGLRKSSRPATTEERGEGRDVSARGLYLEWRDAGEEGVNVWGLSLNRRAGQLQFRADLVRAGHRAADLEMTGVAATATLPELALQDVKAASTRVLLSLADNTGRRLQANTPQPAAGSRGVPRSGLVAAFTFSPGRGQRIRTRLEALGGILARRLPVGGHLELDGVHLVVRHGAQQLNLGPARLSGVRSEETVSFSFSPGGAQRQEQLQFELSLPVAKGPVKVSVGGGPLALSELGVREGDFGLTGVRHAELEVELIGELSDSGEVMDVASAGEVRNVSLLHDKIAPHVLTNIGLAWSGKGKLSVDGSKVVISEAELRFGAVKAVGRLNLQRDDQRLVLDANLEVPAASCQDMFDSLPVGIVPLLQGAKFRGDFSWKGSLALDTDRLSAADVSWRMKNRCHITSVPEEADPQRFTVPFSRSVPSPDGVPLMVWSGPGSVDWVPLEQISRYLEIGVLTTEDGGFWAHSGFDQGAIEGSIKQNLQAGSFVRGASTITMQLAKNLYLSRDKHLSRKVQEALLTMLLEQELTKAQILELYFNVIEFGPDIWGIGMAADHYFHSSPAELSLAQSFFLASLLPKPLARHFEEDGRLKPSRRAYIRRLMHIAHGRGRLTAAELAEGVRQEVHFGVPHLSTAPDDDWEQVPDWEGGRQIDGL